MTDIKKRLLDLAATSARSRPIHFAGRSDIIAKILRLAANPPPNGAEGSTVLIAGAPGAGKTALIRHIERLLLEQGAGTVMCSAPPNAPELARSTKSTRKERTFNLRFFTTARTKETSVAPPAIKTIEQIVVLQGHGYRSEYYSDRIDAADAPLEIIAALHRRIAEGGRLDRFDAAIAIEGVVEAMGEGTEKDLARRLVGAGETCFDRMLRAGIVSLDYQGYCVSPVPSLSAHIFKRFAPGSEQPAT